MNVQEFLAFFRNDIPSWKNTKWTFEDYQKWHPIFFERTSDFHKEVKQSYFEQTNKLIDENDFERWYGVGTLGEFAYLGLFGQDDEAEFSDLIRKLKYKLDKTENETEITDILDFTYSFCDFLLHEYYPEEDSDLRKLLIELKMKILEKHSLDHKKTGDLVIRFIDMMI